jgi:Transposase DDE domain group 1
MTNCNKYPIVFSSLKNKKIVGNFQGGDITSDTGVLFLREIDKKINLTQNLSKIFDQEEGRQKAKVIHNPMDMLRQRIYSLALGYEDLNDHRHLRKDKAFQIAVEKSDNLASPSTLCRFENKFDRKLAIAMHQEMLNQFVKSFKEKPKELILDFDSTDLPIYGNQINKHYHGYYKNDCFLPLHVFCGEQLLVSYLRPSNIDGAQHSWGILSLLVKCFREIWPEVKILFRADSGFCRQKMLTWCEKNKVDYIVGIGANPRLQRQITPLINIAKTNFEITGEKQQLFTDFYYSADTWNKQRRIIGKAEYNRLGDNKRFIITTLSDPCEEIYKNVYCPRGNMENKIKEQFELFSYRTSCHEWWPNQFRMLLSGLAYVLIEKLRSLYLKGTHFINSEVNTIRLKILKIGSVICHNTRRIRLYISSSYAYQSLFNNIIEKLNSG